MTKEELQRLRVPKTDQDVSREVKIRWDCIAKPLDSLGRFETIFARIGAICGSADIELSSKAVLVMCADNGIVEEGISQSGQEVTAIVAESMAAGRSSVCKMARYTGAAVKVIDIGVSRELAQPGILHRKVAFGTKNFLKEPAMSERETLEAIQTGIELVRDSKNEGIHILAMGEMGIGNTTTSSAVAAALLGCPAEALTGKGAGLSEAGLQRKKDVIVQALLKYDLDQADPLTILSSVGGLDIAGLAGVCIGGALYRVPVVMDGVISAVAALAAERLVPGIRNYLIPSHKSKEPAAVRIMDELGLQPVIDAEMALGEGTGAVMMFALLEIALSVYGEQTRFGDIGMEKYKRFERGAEQL